MFTIVFNPAAGNKKIDQILKRVCDILTGRHINYTTFEISTKQGPEVYQAIPCGNDDTVCILGGDGTVLHTFNKLSGDSFRLMIVPCGTGNDFIKSLGLPKDPIKAFISQLNGDTRHADYLTANNRRFLNVMGAGFDVNVLCKLNAFKHKFSGLKAYLMAVIQSIKEYSPIELEINRDDTGVVKKKLSVISIGNGRFIGGGMKAVPSAVPDDGLIDVVEVRAIKRWQLLFLLPLFICGLHIKFGLGKSYRCRSLRLASAGLTYQLDGEIFSDDSVTVNLIPDRLRVFK